MIDFSIYQEFEWDEWNIQKNQEKHRVTVVECEQIFSDPQKRIFNNRSHSTNKEERFILIGSTARTRALYVAFTIRNKRIRVISARDLNRKERYLYEEKIYGSKTEE
ncbi:BrnT family toxin [Candidatus Uhrbacteria bacterium]|nr:BrnT family toxin [Candidatus Uhrbacteria bacterium]